MLTTKQRHIMWKIYFTELNTNSETKKNQQKSYGKRNVYLNLTGDQCFKWHGKQNKKMK